MHTLIPVLRIINSGGVPYGKPKERVLTDPNCMRYNEVCFVQAHDLVSIKTEHDRVLVVIPAPCRAQDWQEGDKRCGGWPRVSFGVYWPANHLLLIEDIEKWCHHRLDFDHIRSIFDLKCEMTVKTEAKNDQAVKSC